MMKDTQKIMEGEALREIDPCSEDPNWETANYTQDRPLYNSSLICNCCYPGVVKCHVVHQLSLYANNLSGPIPIYVYLENMTSPVYVRLENSMYCGTVPPELAKLFKMEHLIFTASCQVMFNGGFNSIINMPHHDLGTRKENKLAVQYGPNVCSTANFTCRDDTPNKFTIHGLWPNETSPRINRTFDPALLHGVLLEQLKEHWPGLQNRCDRNYWLWSHEWETHGRYYYNGSNPGSQVGYFQNGVNLFLKNEIKYALGNLSEPGEYKTFVILERLKNITTFVPSLYCKNDSHNRTLLTEIKFCLQADLTTLTDCKKNQSGCGTAFYVKLNEV
nr:ribonuclease 3-like isoform X3 [Ziziphus jujuba var. spinosa]